MTERVRAGVVLIDDEGRVAMIKRHRDGRTYYALPGGGVEHGESLEGAARREALEELGVEVVIRGLVARVRVEIDGDVSRQHYFAARIAGGSFGTGTGAEYASDRDPARGSYHPMWVDLAASATEPIVAYPAPLIVAIAERGIDALLAAPLDIVERGWST